MNGTHTQKVMKWLRGIPPHQDRTRESWEFVSPPPLAVTEVSIRESGQVGIDYVVAVTDRFVKQLDYLEADAEQIGAHLTVLQEVYRSLLHGNDQNAFLEWEDVVLYELITLHMMKALTDMAKLPLPQHIFTIPEEYHISYGCRRVGKGGMDVAPYSRMNFTLTLLRAQTCWYYQNYLYWVCGDRIYRSQEALDEAMAALRALLEDGALELEALYDQLIGHRHASLPIVAPDDPLPWSAVGDVVVDMDLLVDFGKSLPVSREV